MLDRAQVAIRKVLRKAGLIGIIGKAYRLLIPEFLRRRVRVSEFDLKYGDRDIYEALILGERVQFSSRDRYSKHWFFPRYENSIHEPDVTHLFARDATEASGIIDVGANLGWYTCIGAVLSEGTVWSLEMDPENVQRLRKNVQLNEVDNVEIIHAAADEEKGIVSYERNSGAAEFKIEQGNGESHETVDVEATTIDRVLMPSGEVDLMKIDVEGAELRVLRGAVRTLETMKPKIILEVHPSRLFDQEGSIEELIEIMSGIGYDIYEVASTDSSGRDVVSEKIGKGFEPERITTIYATV
jgi:FkbM family methyltransferase